MIRSEWWVGGAILLMGIGISGCGTSSPKPVSTSSPKTVTKHTTTTSQSTSQSTTSVPAVDVTTKDLSTNTLTVLGSDPLYEGSGTVGGMSISYYRVTLTLDNHGAVPLAVPLRDWQAGGSVQAKSFLIPDIDSVATSHEVSAWLTQSLYPVSSLTPGTSLSVGSRATITVAPKQTLVGNVLVGVPQASTEGQLFWSGVHTIVPIMTFAQTH